MTTNISEKGLETIIMRYMTGVDGLTPLTNRVAENPVPYGGSGYIPGAAHDYDRSYSLDVVQLFAFLAPHNRQT